MSSLKNGHMNTGKWLGKYSRPIRCIWDLKLWKMLWSVIRRFLKWISESLLWIKWYFHIGTDVFIHPNCSILAHRGRFPRLTLPETNRLTDIAPPRLRRDPKGNFLVSSSKHPFSVRVVFCCYSSFQGGLFLRRRCVTTTCSVDVDWFSGWLTDRRDFHHRETCRRKMMIWVSGTLWIATGDLAVAAISFDSSAGGG